MKIEAQKSELAARPDGANDRVVRESLRACPVCRNTEFRTLFEATDRLYDTTDKKFQIVECKQCRLIRLFPQPGADELRAYYPDTYWLSPEEETVDRLEEIYRRFVLRDHLSFVCRALESLPTDGLVLDVGCGGGLFLKMLAERGHRVAGLDFSRDAARLAWRGNRVPAVCATLSNPPFAPGSCAAVTMFHVLEHVYDPQSYLAEARALLKPEGRLIIQVPNAACWQLLLLGKKWSGLDVPRHLWNFRPRDLDLLLDRNGFEVVRRRYFSLRDNPAGLATSLAPGLDPMARRVRRIGESPRAQLCKNLIYFCLVAACLPFAFLEAAFHAGSTIMVEARRKS
jgi:SAM-dependent methyltransferase/predicted nucleic-acid-binding Zn-ribbon protein